MYIPKHFAVTNSSEITRFILSNGFGQIVSSVGGELFATHLPFLYYPEEKKLIGHIARANPQWQELDGQSVLVILAGTHGYISPNWYIDAGVPTWNYQAVHIRGRAQCFMDAEHLQKVVNGLTEQYEASQEVAWQPDYEPQKLRGIVGIEIAIDEIQCKYKLSQNRSEAEQIKIIEKLRASGDIQLAGAMENLNSNA